MINRRVTHSKIVSYNTIQKLEEGLNKLFDKSCKSSSQDWEPYNEDMFYINKYNLKLVIYNNPRFKVFKCKIIQSDTFIDLLSKRQLAKFQNYRFPYPSVNIKGEYIQVGYILEFVKGD